MGAAPRSRPGVRGLAGGIASRPYLRLDRNENPYGCSLLVQESLSICDSFGSHPDELPPTLVDSVCRYAACRPSGVHLANSRHDLLEQVLRAVAVEGARVPVWGPVERPVQLAAQRCGVRLDVYRAAPGCEGSGVAPMLEWAAGAPLVFVSSPNEITGASVSALEIGTLLQRGTTVVLDETYREYSENAPGALGREYDGLVSLRSFGSWAGLWGIPVSYFVADVHFTERVEATYPSDGLTRASRIAAGASLDDAAALLGRVRLIRKERGRLYRQLRKLNLLQPYPSDGPAVLCKVTRGDTQSLVDGLRMRGIIVRDCADVGLEGFVRVSVGTPEDTDQLMDALLALASRG